MAKTKEAAPKKEASGWSMRRRVCGQNLDVSGHKTQTAAQEAMDNESVDQEAKAVIARRTRGSPP